MISALKQEPDWLLEFRLDAFRKWQKMEMPRWGHLDMPEIDFQDVVVRRHIEQAKAQAQTQAQRSFEQAQRRFDAVRRRWPWHASSAASERDTVQDVVWRDLPPR